ncbi:flagella assembly protein FlgT [Pseudoalteromonas denitrificans]|uniref:Flagellar assembly protein T, C-terminal domain n=1 Tax=Pseudoalteromonas denitrificans DSM 6059 TaxID=1123010 RepID=A0A1I1HMS3_9GAMM|nr:flagella assembly protein FlgT [Pseudoalteromonas denitrificans]SFC25409.1 Flagellar assembly protein T, C-terminal domain [Pseudoalteromonas denitrificans DSM 6059]
MYKFLCLFFLYFPLLSQAQWYESTGQSQVRDGDNNSAKNRAIEDAIKQALIFAGASVSSIQTVANGVMTQEQTHISSHGEIERIELIDEVYSKDTVSVTLRLDIFANEQQCFASEFKKSLAITQVQMPNREHARTGQIFDINKIFGEKIFKSIKLADRAITPRPYYQHAIRTEEFFNQHYNFNPRIIEQLAHKSDSQYVLISKIKDISMGEKQNSEFMFWQSNRFERFFGYELILFNALTQEIVMQKDYSTSGIWRFKKTARVDVKSQKFWHSEYGQSINNLSNQISLDLQEKLSCLPLQGQIKHIKENTITFNLGKEHGVKKGQSFSIAYQSYFTDPEGNKQPYIITSANQVRVNQVYTRSAIANSIGDKLLANIQTSDIVLLVELKEPEL